MSARPFPLMLLKGEMWKTKMFCDLNNNNNSDP